MERCAPWSTVPIFFLFCYAALRVCVWFLPQDVPLNVTATSLPKRRGPPRVWGWMSCGQPRLSSANLTDSAEILRARASTAPAWSTGHSDKTESRFPASPQARPEPVRKFPSTVSNLEIFSSSVPKTPRTACIPASMSATAALSTAPIRAVEYAWMICLPPATGENTSSWEEGCLRADMPLSFSFSVTVWSPSTWIRFRLFDCEDLCLIWCHGLYKRIYIDNIISPSSIQKTRRK